MTQAGRCRRCSPLLRCSGTCWKQGDVDRAAVDRGASVDGRMPVPAAAGHTELRVACAPRGPALDRSAGGRRRADRRGNRFRGNPPQLSTSSSWMPTSPGAPAAAEALDRPSAARPALHVRRGLRHLARRQLAATCARHQQHTATLRPRPVQGLGGRVRRPSATDHLRRAPGLRCSGRRSAHRGCATGDSSYPDSTSIDHRGRGFGSGDEPCLCSSA